MDQPSSVAVVANPYSGARENRSRVAALLRELDRRGLEPVAMWGRDELATAAAEAGFAERFRCVVAAGGDGTLHRVVNTTLAVPIVMFPLGTENLFAQEFHHSGDPAAMATMIAGGRAVNMDIGRVSYLSSELGTRNAELSEREALRPPTLFSIVLSAGFDAEVIHRLHLWRCRHPEQLRRVKRSSYLRPILAAALGYTFPAMQVEADGVHHHAVMCMVFNLPRYGLGLRVWPPEACGSDGLLDYVVFDRPGRIALARCGISAKLGRLHSRPDIRHGRARRIRLTPADGGRIPLEFDGEESGFAPIEIEALPAAMKVLTPRTSA